MTITLDLEPDVEARLTARATRRGQDVQGYVQEIVTRDAQQEPAEALGAQAPPEQTLAEALKGFIGIVDSSQANSGQKSHSAENHSELFGDHVAEKWKIGRLSLSVIPVPWSRSLM